MSPTRVIRSLLHPDDLARLVEREYDVAAPVTARLLGSGFNDSYRVTDRDGDVRVLRVYARDKHWVRSESDLLFELELLEHLAAAGRRVSHPYPRRTTGNAVLGHLTAPEGERCFALFSFAAGASADERPLDRDGLAALGAEIARIHAATDTFRSRHGRYRLDAEVLVDRPLGAIEGHATPDQRDQLATLRRLAGRLTEHLSGLGSDPPEYGVIHGDVHPGNLAVTAAGEFVLLDFDLCGYGWRAYDLAELFRGPGAPAEERASWAAVLAGYESVRRLSGAERAALPVLAACRGIWDVGDMLRDAHCWATRGPRRRSASRPSNGCRPRSPASTGDGGGLVDPLTQVAARVSVHRVIPAGSAAARSMRCRPDR